jgi:hypothetical protein
VVHSLDHHWKVGRPVVASAGDQPDAPGIAPGHESVAVALDFVNPIGGGLGLVGCGGKARLDEFGLGGQAPTHTLNQHLGNVGAASAFWESLLFQSEVPPQKGKGLALCLPKRWLESF